MPVHDPFHNAEVHVSKPPPPVQGECRMSAGCKSSRGEGSGRRVKQGHGKGGGWNIGHDRGECAGRRPGLRTSRKEEQVKVKSEGMSRAIRGQSRQGRGENEAEGREDRNKLST